MKRHTILWLTIAAAVVAVVVTGAIIAAKAVAGNPHDTDQVTFNGPWQAHLNDATLNAVISGTVAAPAATSTIMSAASTRRPATRRRASAIRTER